MAGINNKREEAVHDEIKRLGWEAIGKGWPDFLAYNPETKKVVFLEVKTAQGSGSQLRKEQRIVHERLKSLGLNVQTIRIGKATEKHLYKVNEALLRLNALD